MNGLEPLRVGGNLKVARPPSGWRWLRRLGLWLLAVIAVLALAGAVYQALGSRADASAYPPPGQLYPVGDQRLHLHCVGEGSPTVILDTLSGGTSVNWAWVQPELARSTRVCSYDRAGRGWSEPRGGESKDLWGTVSDLRTLLEVAGVEGPFVLVGHSIGGNYVRAFAQANPSQVAGVVLLDSSHPELFDRHPEYAQNAASYLQIARFFPTLANLGLFRVYFATGGELDFQGLPERQHAELAAFWSSPGYHRSQVSETRAAPTVFAQARELGTLGEVPLLVISAGDNPDDWSALQRELAALSTTSSHLTISDATHVSLAFDEAHAARVSELIATMVESLRP